MATVVYVPAPGYDSSEKGTLNLGNGVTFDVGAALTSGGGQISVDSSANPTLVNLLDHYPGLIRSGVTPGPVVVPDSIAPVLAHSGSNPQPGDLIKRGSDGIFTPQSRLDVSQLPLSAANAVSGGYTLEGDYGAPASGSVQTALQNAVTDILTNKGGGKLFLKDRIYDFDSITWPSIGFDKPTPTLEIVGPRMPQTAGFMPGVGLTLAQGKDMPAPTTGAILRSTQTSAESFGGLSGGSNLLVVLRNFILRVPTNPQWHGIHGGWLANLVTEGIVVDQGRSWGDGTNPLSPGPIVQPTNSGVYGIIYPGTGNGGVVVARDVLVCGFYNGLIHSEHFDGDRIVLAKNVIGLLPREGYHASRIGRLSTYWNTYDIQPINQGGGGAPCTRLKIHEWDTEEDAVGGNWYTTVYHFNDPNNYSRGEASYHREVPGGNPGFSLLIRGGAYFNLAPVTNPSRLIDSVGFEGADSATVLPNSWSGQVPTQLRGAWGISSKRAYIGTVSGTNGGDLAVWETGLTNLVLRCRVKSPATATLLNMGLALFAVDANNWITAAIFNSAGNAWTNIQKSDAGVWTNLSGTSSSLGAVASGKEYDLHVRVIGKTIKLFVDGVLTSTYTMTGAEWTKYSASTSHGFLSWTGAGGEPGGANGGRWDALRIEPSRVLTA